MKRHSKTAGRKIWIERMVKRQGDRGKDSYTKRGWKKEKGEREICTWSFLAIQLLSLFKQAWKSLFLRHQWGDGNSRGRERGSHSDRRREKVSEKSMLQEAFSISFPAISSKITQWAVKKFTEFWSAKISD